MENIIVIEKIKKIKKNNVIINYTQIIKSKLLFFFDDKINH